MKRKHKIFDKLLTFANIALTSADMWAHKHTRLVKSQTVVVVKGRDTAEASAKSQVNKLNNKSNNYSCGYLK